jgi:hypothetical protein
MGRGLTRASSLIDGFNGMYDAIGRVQRDQELRAVASATPTMDQGFTPEQGAQLQAAANSGQYDVTWDDASKSYKVQPKAGGEAGTIAQGQRQTFLGQVQDKPLDDAGISRARRMAMAGVLERHGELANADHLRAGVAAEDDRAYRKQRQQVSDAREDERWRRDEERYKQDQAYHDGMAAVIDNSTFGQRSKAFQEQVTKYEADKKAYDAKVAAGDTSAVAPPVPVQPTMTPGERMADAAAVISFKAKHGKATPEELMKVSEQMANLGKEGYLQFLNTAQAGAPLTAVVQAYNATGKDRIDPAAIIKDERVKRPGGVETRVITYRAPDGTTKTIDTYADLTALGHAAEALKVAQQEHTQRNQDRQAAVAEGNLRVHQAAEGRHATEFKENAPERKARAAIADLQTKLAETDDPKEQARIQEKLQALKTGTRGGGTAGGPTAMEKNARLLVSSGQAPDLQTAVEMLSQNPEKLHAEFVKRATAAMPGGDPAKAVAQADKTMQAMGYVRNQGQRWTKAPAAGGAPQAGRSFASEADAAAAEAAGKLQKGERVVIGGVSGTWVGHLP